MGETIVYGLKIALAVAVATAFSVAIIAFVGGLSTLVFDSIVGEVLLLVSVMLPFSPLPVFGAIQLSITAILAFLVARKIYDLCSNYLLGTA